jgi:hypothetical protein
MPKNVIIEPKIDHPPPDNPRDEIKRMILEMTNNDDNRAKAMLIQLTRVKGKSHVSQLTDKQIPSTYRKVKELYGNWQRSDLDKFCIAIQLDVFQRYMGLKEKTTQNFSLKEIRGL